jgi:ribokinase
VSGRVIVVGSVNVDLVARGERLPAPGETVTGAAYSEHDGGKGANQAVAAARLGGTVAFVGAIGRDAFGERARGALAREGIDLAGVVEVDAPTGVALILVDARGENLISVASGANAALTREHVAGAFESLKPTEGDIVLVGHEIPTATGREALRLGRSAGATTILNPAPAAGIDRSVFGLADILVPNRIELAAIADRDARSDGRAAGAAGRPIDAAHKLLQPTSEGPGVARAVIVTLGSDGAVLVRATGDPVDLPAPRIRAIDAVGAGDTCAGALAAGLASGLELGEAARRAVIAAAISTQLEGAREGMPSAEELDAFVAI